MAALWVEKEKMYSKQPRLYLREAERSEWGDILKNYKENGFRRRGALAWGGGQG